MRSVLPPPRRGGFPSPRKTTKLKQTTAKPTIRAKTNRARSKKSTTKAKAAKSTTPKIKASERKPKPKKHLSDIPPRGRKKAPAAKAAHIIIGTTDRGIIALPEHLTEPSSRV